MNPASSTAIFTNTRMMKKMITTHKWKPIKKTNDVTKIILEYNLVNLQHESRMFSSYEMALWPEGDYSIAENNFQYQYFRSGLIRHMCLTYIANYHFSERLQDMIQKACLQKTTSIYFCENDFLKKCISNRSHQNLSIFPGEYDWSNSTPFT